jgi:predicted nucleic acid-binding protein
VILVVDASAAYDLLTERTCADRVRGVQELIAPDLVVAELLNARWKAERSGKKAPLLEVTIEFLDRLRIVPSLRYASDAALLAARLSHPVYDCLYVAAAARENAKLLTIDSRLVRKVKAGSLARILR